jgi:hypothetical protein
MDLSAQPQLQIFNSDLSGQDQRPNFHIFPLLTTELRLQVWKHALRSRQRLIRVQLYAQTKEREEATSELVTETATNHQSSQCAVTPPYTIVAEGYQTLSKFMRVNREARAEALRFYRVQIPCRLTSDPNDNDQQTVPLESTKPGKLYINPEYDFLHIDNNNALRASDDSVVDHILVDFIHQLKTRYDPLHVGLLNLAFGKGSSVGFQHVDLDSNPEAKISFLATIQQLHEIYFLIEPRTGRLNFRWIYGMDEETFFTRSFPIFPLTPSFERPQQRDPRHIGEDLNKIRFSIGEPRETPESWSRLLRQWGVTQNLQTSCKYLVALRTGNARFGIYNRNSAAEYLNWEDQSWRHPDAGRFMFEDENLEKAVKPAFGFWLFDMGTFGSFTKDGDIAGHGANGYVIWDLTNHWPELALSSLP